MKYLGLISVLFIVFYSQFNNNNYNGDHVSPYIFLTLDQKVLLGGEDSLLCLVMGELTGAEVGGGAALGKQNCGLGCGMCAESGSGKEYK